MKITKIANGTEYRLCRGPKHRPATWVPLDEKHWLYRKDRPGHVQVPCRSCRGIGGSHEDFSGDLPLSDEERAKVGGSVVKGYEILLPNLSCAPVRTFFTPKLGEHSGLSPSDESYWWVDDGQGGRLPRFGEEMLGDDF